MSTVAELKAKGNAAFSAKNFDEAIQHYSDAIKAASDPAADAVHVLYSNRSACYSGLKQWEKALEDAEETIKLNPSFAKGYGRKGGALHGARKYDDAIAAYEEGLKVAPGDATLTKGLADVKRAAEERTFGEGPGEGLGKLFSDPQLFAKLSANPKTAPLLADAGFMTKLQQIQKNPQLAGSAFSDPRMIQVMGVLMGIDMQAFERPEGSNDLPADLEPKREEIEKQTGRSSAKEEPKASGSSISSSKPAEPAPEVEMKEASEEDKAKAEAEEEKKKGNALYLKKDFQPAIEHYKKAWDLHKDITYLNNLGACYFEQGNYDECIATCEKAVEEGRELRADYKLIAKAFGRVGSAYSKKDDLDNAIKFYNKSLTEHRTPDILAKLRDTEKLQKQRAQQAYIDPAKADEERNKGNDLYKAGNFAASVSAYTESIKRNPSDPRGYTNRASAYIKLAAFPEALKDCEEAIKVDPKNVKAFIRKSTVLVGMKEYTKALEAIQVAQDLDNESEDKKNAKEISQQMDKIMREMYTQRANETDEQTLERAMKDPEVAQIMSDPIMQSILQQAQSNPAALQDHMKNPGIRAKIQKLVAAGIIRTR